MVYYEEFADALPDPRRVAEEKERLEKAGIKYILSCWIDMLGVPKTKPVPISDFELVWAKVPNLRFTLFRSCPNLARPTLTKFHCPT